MQLEAKRTIVIEAIDEHHCRHSVEGDVRVRIFGIGRLAENGVIDSTVKTFRALPNVLERQALPAAPMGRNQGIMECHHLLFGGFFLFKVCQLLPAGAAGQLCLQCDHCSRGQVACL